MSLNFYNHQELLENEKLFAKLNKVYPNLEDIDYCLGGTNLSVLQPTLLLSKDFLTYINPTNPNKSELVTSIPLNCIESAISKGTMFYGIELIPIEGKPKFFFIQVSKEKAVAMENVINEYIRNLDDAKDDEIADYDSMTIEELEELKRKKLVEELKAAQHSSQSTQTSSTTTNTMKFTSKPSRMEQAMNKRKGVLVCPNCGSTHIQVINNSIGGKKTTVDINPLKPLTILKTKDKQKKVKREHHSVGMAIATGGASLFLPKGKKKASTEWYCQDCGKRFYN
ncbi:hypothetical protein DW969_07785 [Eubacterium sp. AM47-9]|nr:hypothetical protein DW969_07785 [Eubacterium sp. AM47-9]